MDIPIEKQICKYCYWCSCVEDTEGATICEADRKQVDVDSVSCDFFEYDDTFRRF